VAFRLIAILIVLLGGSVNAKEKHNVLFIISDDLTSTALGCYGNKICKTPNIDRLATQGTRFARAYCQATICGPSRASLMFGYYPYASKATGYTSGRKEVGADKDSWAQYFKKNGYHSARISKVFHMGVPTDIGPGRDGADDPASWDEAYNSPGPESKAAGFGETLQNNPGGLKKGAAGGNRFSTVEADGDHLVHSDGKTAEKAVKLIRKYKDLDKPFFLAVGFVRPHVPLVAPRKYFGPYPVNKIILPPKVPNDWDDIPMNSANRRTSENWKMNLIQQKKVVRAYYASVSFMDAMTGKVLKALEETGQRDNTIVILTSDNGYHVGEKDCIQKWHLWDESTRIPLLVHVPGSTVQGRACEAPVSHVDLYPTLVDLCDLPKQPHKGDALKLDGHSLNPFLNDPNTQNWNGSPVALMAIRDGQETPHFSVRSHQYRYTLCANGEEEFYDHDADPHEWKNLSTSEEHVTIKKDHREKLMTLLRDTKMPEGYL